MFSFLKNDFVGSRVCVRGSSGNPCGGVLYADTRLQRMTRPRCITKVAFLYERGATRARPICFYVKGVLSCFDKRGEQVKQSRKLSC